MVVAVIMNWVWVDGRAYTERPLRLVGEAVIGRLGDIATKLPDEVIKAMPEIPWRESCLARGARSASQHL